MKKLAVLSALVALSTSSFALKIGYVNTQELFGRYSQTKVVRESLGKQKTELEAKLQKEEVELQKIQVELQSKGEAITPDEKKSFEEKVAKFKKLVQDSQTKLSKEEGEKMQSIERLINISITNVAKTGKYDFVLEQGAIKFGGENITGKVLEIMEKSKKVN